MIDVEVYISLGCMCWVCVECVLGVCGVGVRAVCDEVGYGRGADECTFQVQPKYVWVVCVAV